MEIYNDSNVNETHHCEPCSHLEEKEKEIDELLEIIWELGENGIVNEIQYKSSAIGKTVLENLPVLVKSGLLKVDDGHVKFTKTGEDRAKNIVRRHRLAERMLTDLFQIPTSNIEGTSCEFEHILNEEVTDSICSFLGHPQKCPHGKPIPRGECCKKLVTTIRSLVIPLSDLNIGEKATITFIASKDKHRLQKLSSLGIIPGGQLTLQQKIPEIIIKVGETEIAIDKSLAGELYLKPLN